MPHTVPNGPSDVATFAGSNVTDIFLSANTEISQIIFAGGASAYSVAVSAPFSLTVDAPGITNASSQTQNFVINGNSSAFGTMFFKGVSSAGSATVITANGGAEAGGGGGVIEFDDTSSASNSTLIANPATAIGAAAGQIFFTGKSTAATATIVGAGYPAFINFADTTTADHATISLTQSELDFSDNSNAGSTTITMDGGATLALGATAFAGATATVIDNDGVIIVEGMNDARVELFNPGFIEVSFTGTQQSVGSLEGDGTVFIPNGHTFILGSNNLNTEFAGILQNDPGARDEREQAHGGALRKVGTGALTLSGASTYSGGTTVVSGLLVVANSSDSATGRGAVAVTAGTLGGSGIIAGATTIGSGSGTGAFLAPAAGTNVQATLTIQSALAFNADATYTYTFRAKRNRASTDKVIANGATINGGATLALSGQTRGALRQGLVLTLISNTSANPISGTFANLPDGGIVTINGNNLQASYSGGDGNDLTLTVVP